MVCDDGVLSMRASLITTSFIAVPLKKIAQNPLHVWPHKMPGRADCYCIRSLYTIHKDTGHLNHFTPLAYNVSLIALI